MDKFGEPKYVSPPAAEYFIELRNWFEGLKSKMFKDLGVPKEFFEQGRCARENLSE